jgi:hypothetical protein
MTPTSCASSWTSSRSTSSSPARPGLLVGLAGAYGTRAWGLGPPPGARCRLRTLSPVEGGHRTAGRVGRLTPEAVVHHGRWARGPRRVIRCTALSESQWKPIAPHFPCATGFRRASGRPKGAGDPIAPIVRSASPHHGNSRSELLTRKARRHLGSRSLEVGRRVPRQREQGCGQRQPTRQDHLHEQDGRWNRHARQAQHAQQARQPCRRQ